ncbi:unnamed protein product [Ectocarpus sp. 4 AP-2014]
MLMLAQPSISSASVSVVLSGGGSFGWTLAGRIATAAIPSEVRSSPVLENWEGLKDVCTGADTVYLLSALDLPPSPNDSDLQAFTAGVGRVVDCCLECGVEGLVFTSSSSVFSSAGKAQGPTEHEGEDDVKARAVARAEARVLDASGATSPSRLHTCALRPAAFVYGTSEKDGPLHRALSWVGWGLNRVAVGPKCPEDGGVKVDMVHLDNLAEAHLLAGARLKKKRPETDVPNAMVDVGADVGGADAEQRRGPGSKTEAAPACAGQAYDVTDGQPRNPQTFLDEILDGLGFTTSKLLRVPTTVALSAALVAELLRKVGITTAPALTISDIRGLTEARGTHSNARAQRDFGYVPRVDPATATKRTVESLKRDGWARHRVRRPALAYWITNPGGIWLVTLAAFGGPCPAFAEPLARSAGHVGLRLLKEQSTVRAVCIAVYLVHVLEGVYAFRVARHAGHRDAAPGWFAQTFLLGFPSVFLVNDLKRAESTSKRSTSDGGQTKTPGL